MYRAVLRSVRDPDEAEDVTQLAFLDAYRALQRGDAPQFPRAWLLTIAQNIARRRHVRRAGGPVEVELVADLLVAPEDEGPTAREIRLAFERLGARQRKALILREVAGRSYREIAVALDLSVPAVETLLFRARRSFRQALAGAEGPRVARRTLGGLLLWPLSGGVREAAASIGAWVAGRGATAKLAGGLAAAALGTGVVLQQAPSVAPGPAQRPDRAAPIAFSASTSAEPRPSARHAAAPSKAKRATRERRTARADAAPASTPTAQSSTVEQASEPAAPVVGLGATAVDAVQEVVAPVERTVDEVTATVPEVELPPVVPLHP